MNPQFSRRLAVFVLGLCCSCVTNDPAYPPNQEGTADLPGDGWQEDENGDALPAAEPAESEQPGDPLPSPEECNGLDDDRDGETDEGCTCLPGQTQTCYPGLVQDLDAPRGTCAVGAQSCDGAGELGQWGPCEGPVLPAIELCGTELDEDCDGEVDEGCLCEPGEERPCYTGPAGTAGLGVCQAGAQICDAYGLGFGPCEGQVGPVAEVCNAVDDDCNGLVDELDECNPCLEPSEGSVSPWQIHRGRGAVPFGYQTSQHGDPAEYDLATIPAEHDWGWAAHAAESIDFSDPSTLCGVCECRYCGDFTYFQTFVDISEGYEVTSLLLTMESVDDGAMVTIINSAFPTGVADPGSYITLSGSRTSSDLAGYLVPGRNRIVITHVDDCCRERILRGVTIELNGVALGTC